jgi:hypothetical protein
VDDKLLACPLCGNRIDARPSNRVHTIRYDELREIIAVQVRNRKKP